MTPRRITPGRVSLPAGVKACAPAGRPACQCEGSRAGRQVVAYLYQLSLILPMGLFLWHYLGLGMSIEGGHGDHLFPPDSYRDRTEQLARQR